MIAICGATGKVGGTAARVLRERGLPVTAVVRDASKAGALRELGCRIAVADLQDETALRDALRGSEQVLAICPLSTRAVDVMAEAQRHIETLLNALGAARPRHVLAISDYGAHVESDTGITKIFNLLERLLRSWDGSVTLLRSAEHMQNWLRQLSAARERGVLPSLHHPVTRRFPTVSAYDVGAVAADLLAGPHLTSGKARVVHVEGPARYCANDVAAVFAARLGREVAAHEVPRTEWERALRAAGLTPSYAHLIAQLQDAHNAGLIDIEPAGEIRHGTTELRSALTTPLTSGETAGPREVRGLRR